MMSHPCTITKDQIWLPFACLAVGIAVLALLSSAFATNTSDLWGKAGERWSPRSRLPDFSHAGYHSGEKAIPTVRVKANVKDFGAKGDGKADDTQALRDAIAKAKGGAIFLPAGRYKIVSQLEIKKSNLVLRGAGPGSTVLFLSKSLGEILGEAPYWGGLIRVTGEKKGSKLANVVAVARRGDTRLRLSSAAAIRAGQMVRLRMTNPSDNSLGRHLYADQGALNAERRRWYAGRIVDWVVRVKSVEGGTVELVRPLRLDVRPEWKPQIWRHRPTVKEVGIENLTIEFPNAQYGGHHKEAGYHAVFFQDVFNSWVRNVTIVDGDTGIVISGGGYNTVADVTLKTRWRTGEKTSGETGHFGFCVTSLTQDNLITDCQVQTTFVHNLSVNAFANGNVYASITSQSGRFDHHGAAPYENLYTDIVLTDLAWDLFMSGGNRADEPSSGARTTFWNIQKGKGNFPGRIPTLPDGNAKFPQINIIGIDQWTTRKTAGEQWIEKWPGEQTRPTNLYEAQLEHRLRRKDDTPPQPHP